MIKQLLVRLSGFGYLQQICIGCHLGSTTPLCPSCLVALPLFNVSHYHDNLLRWPRVATALYPHKLGFLHACCRYEQPVSGWLRALKFNKSLRHANVLAAILGRSLSYRRSALPQVLLPAPLHSRRYAKRQFNQALEIALALGQYANVDVLHGMLVRRHKTQPQSDLSRTDRLDNVKGAFEAAELPCHLTHVAIIDDVVTTGATMQAMIDALSAKNPDIHIEVWCIALAL